MIEVKGGHLTSVITICNYSSYQDKQTPDVTPGVTPDVTPSVTQTTIKQLNNKTKDLLSPTKKPTEKQSAIIEIFAFWKETMNHKTAKLDAKREKAIGGALKIGYSIDQLKAAILGCSVTPHNIGENEQKERYDGVCLIFKDADQIERFIQNSIQPILPKNNHQQTGERKLKVLN